LNMGVVVDIAAARARLRGAPSSIPPTTVVGSLMSFECGAKQVNGQVIEKSATYIVVRDSYGNDHKLFF
jgi:hypothetical protein